MKTQKYTEDSFLEMMRSFQPVCVVFAALETGAFEALEDSALDARAAARKMKSSPRGTAALLNALVSMGLLNKKGDEFSLTPFVRKHLVQSGEKYIGNMAYHSGHIMLSWERLSESVRTGKPAPRPPVGSAEARERHRHFILAMNDNASRMADRVTAAIGLGKVKSAIDVGGGPGTYAFAFARANPECRVAIFDTPPTCEIAREQIMLNGFQSQVGTIEGDFLKDGLGAGYDLMLMSSILHIYSPAENGKLIKKGFKALCPGGRLVALEITLDSNRTSPPAGAMFSINMLVNTETGSAYPVDEIKGWLAEAGFGRIERKDFDGRVVALIAHKPKAIKK